MEILPTVAHAAAVGMPRRWQHRDVGHIPAGQGAQVSSAVAQSQTLVELLAMREQLRQLWSCSGVPGNQRVADLQAWLKTAEARGSETLQELAAMLRTVRA